MPKPIKSAPCTFHSNKPFLRTTSPSDPANLMRMLLIFVQSSKPQIEHSHSISCFLYHKYYLCNGLVGSVFFLVFWRASVCCFCPFCIGRRDTEVEEIHLACTEHLRWSED